MITPLEIKRITVIRTYQRLHIRNFLKNYLYAEIYFMALITADLLPEVTLKEQKQ